MFFLNPELWLTDSQQRSKGLSIFDFTTKIKQDKQLTYNVTLHRVRVTIDALQRRQQCVL